MTVHQNSDSPLFGRLADLSLLRQKAYIGGRWVDADNGATLAVTDPATGQVLGSVPDMGASETRRPRPLRCAAPLVRAHPGQP
jgi:succinate-semialdehyde dehydrogenase/glutarate-semialdehyde dehydrogenase